MSGWSSGMALLLERETRWMESLLLDEREATGSPERSEEEEDEDGEVDESVL